MNKPDINTELYAHAIENDILRALMGPLTGDELMAHYLSCVFIALRLTGEKRAEWQRRGEFLYSLVEQADNNGGSL